MYVQMQVFDRGERDRRGFEIVETIRLENLLYKHAHSSNDNFV